MNEFATTIRARRFHRRCTLDAEGAFITTYERFRVQSELCPTFFTTILHLERHRMGLSTSQNRTHGPPALRRINITQGFKSKGQLRSCQEVQLRTGMLDTS